GARRSGRLDHAQCPAREFQKRDTGILDLDVDQACGRLGEDGLDIAHHPLQQIHVMAGLVGKHAAVIGPCAAPRILIVVFLRPAPPDSHRAEHELAETAGFYCFPQLLYRNVVAVLLDYEQPHFRLFAGGDHRIRVAQHERHRLFDDEVLAVWSQIKAYGRMRAAGCGYVDDLDLGAQRVHHAVVVREERHGIFFAESSRTPFYYVAHGDQPASGNVPSTEDLGVPLSDSTAANQGKIEHGILPIS